MQARARIKGLSIVVIKSVKVEAQKEAAELLVAAVGDARYEELNKEF